MDGRRNGEPKSRLAGDDGARGSPSSALAPREEILKRARILIVDDEEPAVLLLQRILGQAGYLHVDGTTDPRQAVPLFLEIEPDLILLDLHMPGLDGFEVMDRLRPYVAEGAYLPTMILTADLAPEVRRRAKVAGVKDYLAKPLERSEVLARVKNLLEARFRYLEERAEEGPRIVRVPEIDHKDPVPVRALVEAVDRERRRIASDIHDDSLQNLAGLKLRLELLGRRLDDPENLEVAEMVRIVTLTISRLRRLTFELWGAALGKDGLVETLRSLMEEASEEGSFAYSLVNRLATEPPPECRATTYRIMRETITNARKHAAASLVEVLLETRDDGVLAIVKDDGRGFSPEAAAALADRFGLVSMRERAEMARGWLTVESAPGSGTTVRFWLPLERERERPRALVGAGGGKAA